MRSYLFRSWILLLLGITIFSRIDTAESFFGFGGGYGPGYGYGGGYGQGYGYGGGYGYGYDDYHYDDYMPEEYEHGHHHAPYHAHNRPLGLLYGYNY